MSTSLSSSQVEIQRAITRESEPLQYVEQQTVALDFITTGVVDIDLAVAFARTAFEDRQRLSRDLCSMLGDDYLQLEERERLGYLTRRLSAEDLSVISLATTMSERRETTAHKLGLGARPFTNGRHSSPDTSSAFDSPTVH